MNYFIWDFNPELFDLGFFAPRWYGLCFAVAILAGHYVMQKCFEGNSKRSEDELNSGFVWLVVGLIVGARLGHVLFYEPGYYLSNPLKILAIWQGGLASHGATIGMFIAMILFSKKFKIPVIWILDRLSMSVLIAAPFVRLGNFFNSEIVGKPSELPWAIIFKSVDDIPRHPSQLYESIAYIIGFALFVAYYRWQKGNPKPGIMIGSMFIWIFTARFFIEFTKENQVSFENGMSFNMGQLLSIPMVLIGLVFILGIHNKIKFLRENPF